MTYKIIKQWKTKVDLEATILLTHESHHCGYVEIPKDSIFYLKKYRDKMPEFADYVKNEDIDCCHPNAPTLAILFDIHGGITFSDHPNWGEEDKERWIFGYDCAHYGDVTYFTEEAAKDMIQLGGTWKDKNYCINECESLAKQIVDLSKYVDVNTCK